MARTKIKLRTYNPGTTRRTENSPRETENLLVENFTPAQSQEESIVHIEEIVPLTSQIVSVGEDSPTITSTLDKNDDSLELDQPMSGNKDASANEVEPTSYVRNVDVDDSLIVWRDSPLNLAWDLSMKENYQQHANAGSFRPMTPPNLLVPVDEIFSPKTQKEIRATIRSLFPDGPPPPPPVRPMRRPKKGDQPYIVNCTKRPRVPSPQSLRVFTGDKYGITSTTNCDVDEPEEKCTPEKRANRGTYGSTSKSTFNRQTNEIAERLKLYEKIDRLVGRAPKEPVGHTTKRCFSPLPSTSTDNETIMKNDKHFNESLESEFELDEDEELPEVILDTKKYKKEKDRKENINKEKYDDYTNIILEETNEEMDNNNDVIAIRDFTEIDFDKLIPREKLFYSSDDEPKNVSQDAVQKKIDDYFPPQPKNQSFVPSGVSLIRGSSSDVICVDDIFPNGLHPIPSAHSVNSPVLRASNKNATATETRQSDPVIEVPDVVEPINMSRHASIRAAWDEVQFVSEEIIDRPYSTNIANISNSQVVSQPPSVPYVPRTPELMNELQQILACFTEQYSRNKTKKKNKRTKPRETLVATNNETASVNDENTAPICIDNTATSVNQVASDSIPSANSSQSKTVGECPICLDNLQTDSIASTNCGHVFCLGCIKQSLKISGKRCPTCRKQLKGVGYHQVFLSF